MTEAKLIDDLAIPLQIRRFQILQQSPPLADLHQETAPAGVIFFMRFKMLGELVDRFGEQGDLNVRRPGIIIRASEFVDNRSFLIFV